MQTEMMDGVRVLWLTQKELNSFTRLSYLTHLKLGAAYGLYIDPTLGMEFYRQKWNLTDEAYELLKEHKGGPIVVMNEGLLTDLKPEEELSLLYHELAHFKDDPRGKKNCSEEDCDDYAVKHTSAETLLSALLMTIGTIATELLDSHVSKHTTFEDQYNEMVNSPNMKRRIERLKDMT